MLYVYPETTRCAAATAAAFCLGVENLPDIDAA
jgi:hypothetical protein